MHCRRSLQNLIGTLIALNPLTQRKWLRVYIIIFRITFITFNIITFV